MELFYGGGGSINPNFVYRFYVSSVPDAMWAWLEAYPLTGPFERWYIAHSRTVQQLPEVQIESRKAAYMFSIAYSEYIIKDNSIYPVAL